MRNPVITLTTDFGTDDTYVAIVKGVILGINPEVKIIDVTHSIEPQNIAQAAFLLNITYRISLSKLFMWLLSIPGLVVSDRG